MTPPASYRTEDGVRVDNAGYKLDSQGYRLDTERERIGIVEVPNEDDQSNAEAGYYIRSTARSGPHPADVPPSPGYK